MRLSLQFRFKDSQCSKSFLIPFGACLFLCGLLFLGKPILSVQIPLCFIDSFSSCVWCRRGQSRTLDIFLCCHTAVRRSLTGLEACSSFRLGWLVSCWDWLDPMSPVLGLQVSPSMPQSLSGAGD